MASRRSFALPCRSFGWPLVGLALLGQALLCSSALAQSVYIGPSGGDWDTLANWTGPGPVVQGTAWIDSGTVFATTSTGSTYVTVARTGTTAGVTVTATGELLSQDSTIGSMAGSIGTVLIDGGMWHQPGWRQIGGHGQGTFEITNGGYASNSTAWLGFETDGWGQATVSGPGSQWINSERLVVGHAGQGILNIDQGGSVVSDGGSIADLAGSTGEVTISGLNSEWTVTGSLHVGRAGPGILNLGAAEGDAAAGAGKLVAGQLVFGQNGGSGYLVLNHTGTAYDLSSMLSGHGTIKQMAGTTIYSGDASLFTGETEISGGAFLLNPSGAFSNWLGGNVTVTSGSLGGQGTISGDVTFGANGTLLTRTDDTGGSDHISVGGRLDIANGASVSVLAGDGAYRPGSDYTYAILSAAGGITGNFGVSTDLYFLTPSLEIVGNDLMLTLARNSVDVASAATTPSQRAVAGAVDALGTGNAVYDSFLSLGEAGARDLLDNLSGQQHVAGQQMVANTFALFGNAMGQRRGGAGPDGTTDASAALGFASAPVETAASAAIAAAAAAPASSQTAWLAPIAGIGRIESSSGSTDWLAGGLALGADYLTTIGDAEVMAGIALGYIRSSADSASALSHANSGQIGAYGSWEEGALRLSASLAYGLAHTETDRNLSVGGVDLVATSGAWSQTLGSSIELAYALPMGQGVSVSPLLGLDSGVSHRGATSETGAGAFGLDIAASTWGQLTPVLGVEIAHETATAAGALNTYGRVAWQHDLLDAPDQQMSFTGTSAAFTLAGADDERDSLGLGLGSSLTLKDGLALSVDYVGTIAPNRQSHGLRLSAGSSF